MAFKMFKKSTPETPKAPGGLARFTRKIQLTPTAMDGSLRGEQRRTEILESQLRDVSATAAGAYDEIEELRMRNDMLNEQAVHQKQLIDSLMKQVDETNVEKLQLKSFHEDQLKVNLNDQTRDTKMLDELKKEKNQMSMEVKRLKMELNGYKNLYEQELSRNQQLKGDPASNDKDDYPGDYVLSRTETGASSISVSNYIDNLKIEDINGNEEQKELTITGLMKRVRQLELQLESNTNEYDTSLSNLRNTIMIIRGSKEFIDNGKSFRIMDAAGSTGSRDNTLLHNSLEMDESYDQKEVDGDGETFVLSNLSFLK